MSNRTEAQISAQADLRMSHLAQIEALTRPGLSDCDRLEEFARAAGFTEDELWVARHMAKDCSPARAVWGQGGAQRSLFASLPGCRCPVEEQLSGVPRFIESLWRPTATELEPFSRIQIARRFPTS